MHVPMLVSRIPSNSVSRIGIIFFVVHMLSCMLSFSLIEKSSFEWLTFLILTSSIFAIKVSSLNVFLLFRFVFLASVGLIISVTWSVFDGEVLVGPFGAELQTEQLSKKLILLVVFALDATVVGWWLAAQNTSDLRNGGKNAFCSITLSHSTFFLGCILSSAIAAIFIIVNKGGFIFGSKYTDTMSIPFYVFNVFLYIGMALVFLKLFQVKNFLSKNVIRLFLMVVVTSALITGSRLDYLPQALILFMIIYFFQSGSASVGIKKFLLLSGLLLIFFERVAVMIAHLRYFSNYSFSEIFFRSFSLEEYIFYGYEYPILWFETLNMICGGFYGAVINSDNNGFLFGESYFNYILNTAPAFMGFDRIRGLEWHTHVGTQVMSQGGIFELAEAYWNFGPIGVIIVPLLLSYVHARLLIGTVRRSSKIQFVAFFAFTMISARSVWYGSFSYYRLFTILMLIYAITLVVRLTLVTFKERSDASVYAKSS